MWSLIKQLRLYKSDKYQNSLTVASLKQSVILLIKQNMKQAIPVSAMRLGIYQVKAIKIVIKPFQKQLLIVMQDVMRVSRHHQ